MINITINETLVIANMIFIIIYTLYLFKIKAFNMNAEPLTHQPLFKAAIIVPIVSFFLLGAIVWSGHTLKIDSDGFNNFLNISKLPLAALSLSIPLGVIVNNIHRTIQTDKQIKEAEKKNKTDGFYAHRKNTIEMFENLPFKSVLIVDKRYKIEFENNYTTYRYCFPEASIHSVVYDADEDFTGRIQHNWLTLKDKIKNTNFTNDAELIRHIHSIENILEQIHKILLFKPFNFQEVYATTFLDESGKMNTFRTKFKDEWCLKDAIYAYWHAYIVIIQALGTKFDSQFVKKMATVEHYCHNQDEIFDKWVMFKTSRRNIIGIYSEE